jgi:4-aminobutyrate aminotransferase-like enzyme
MVKRGTKDPDGDLAFEIVRRAMCKGLLMFAPVGFGGGTVKIGPPLVINEEAMKEGLGVFEASIAESIAVAAKT